MTDHEAVSIRVVEHLDEMAGLSERWNALLAQSASRDNVFLTWEWLSTWAKHYLGRDRLWVVLIYQGKDRLIGIAPFCIRRIFRFGWCGIREIQFLGTGEICSSYLDFIVAERDKRVVLHAVYEYLHGNARAMWDTVTLSDVAADSSSIDIWDGLIQECGKVQDLVGMTVCPIVDLGDGIEAFNEAIGGNERYNLQRKRKRLEHAGGYAYERVSSLPGIEAAMEEFVGLHQARWTRKGDAGAFASDRFREFHREIAALFSEKGWVHLDFLLANGQRIAGAYGFVYGRRYSYYLPGFDPDAVPHASPGILLLFRCVEQAIQAGCTQVDLLRGWADYKLAWATTLRRSLTLRHYNRHGRAVMVKLLEHAKDTVKVAVR